MAELIECVCLIVRKGDAILQARPEWSEKWFMPGGKIDDGETPEQALVRELREELNIEIRPDTISYEFTVEAPAHGKPEGTIVRMQCFTADYDGNPVASSELAEIAYFSLSDIDRIAPAGQLVMRRCLKG